MLILSHLMVLMIPLFLSNELFAEKRAAAREKLIQVAEAVLGYKLSKDCVLVVNSGRYEFRNKGVDLFIDSLGELQKKDALGKECIAFILIPAYHKGPRQDIADILYNNAHENFGDKYLTHSLHYPSADPVLQRIITNNLNNDQNLKVKIIFVPSYLNGNDGIFNMPYFDLLIGFDLSVFPSYYEPWGYTPLESLMFSIPTVTTYIFQDSDCGLKPISKIRDTEYQLLRGQMIMKVRLLKRSEA